MFDRISINPAIQGGRPCVAGTRITVQNVLELVNEGVAFPKIIEEYYPDIVIEDIKACVEYAIALVAAEEVHVRAETA